MDLFSMKLCQPVLGVRFFETQYSLKHNMFITAQGHVPFQFPRVFFIDFHTTLKLTITIDVIRD